MNSFLCLGIFVLTLSSAMSYECAGILFTGGRNDDGLIENEDGIMEMCWRFPRVCKRLELSKMITARQNHGIVALHYVPGFQSVTMVAGGQSANESALATTEIITLYRSCCATHKSGPHLFYARRSPGFAQFDDEVWICGGAAKDISLSSCETYKYKDEAWKTGPSMKHGREGMALVAHGYQNSLYAIGGYSNGEYLNSVEKLTANRKWWEMVAPMEKGRFKLGAVAIRNHIYACGGEDSNDVLNICEQYTPNKNTWTRAPLMNTERSGFALVYMSDYSSMYVHGGMGPKFWPLRSIESFNIYENKWINEEYEMMQNRGRTSGVRQIVC